MTMIPKLTRVKHIAENVQAKIVGYIDFLDVDVEGYDDVKYILQGPFPEGHQCHGVRAAVDWAEGYPQRQYSGYWYAAEADFEVLEDQAPVNHGRIRTSSQNLWDYTPTTTTWAPIPALTTEEGETFREARPRGVETVEDTGGPIEELFVRHSTADIDMAPVQFNTPTPTQDVLWPVGTVVRLSGFDVECTVVGYNYRQNEERSFLHYILYSERFPEMHIGHNGLRNMIEQEWDVRYRPEEGSTDRHYWFAPERQLTFVRSADFSQPLPF